MGKLAALHHDEGVRLDPDRMQALVSEPGEEGAEQAVCRAREDRAGRLMEIRRYVDESDVAATHHSARRVSKLARQIGMPTLARSGDDVPRTAETRTVAARAATLARLVRIADRSLNVVWDLRRLMA